MLIFRDKDLIWARYLRMCPVDRPAEVPSDPGRRQRMRWIMSVIKNFWQDESGQDMAEYAVLLGMIALAVITAVELVGGGIGNVLADIGGVLSGAI
jgi:pilus assembly protein Flp/PilA